jgi:hypothetical protein
MSNSGPTREEYEALKTRLAILENEIKVVHKPPDATPKKPRTKEEPPPMMTSKQLFELILSTISGYLRLLEKKKYGALADFARKHGVTPQMLTRIKNRHPNDSYEPTAISILTLIKAILRNPLELTMEGATTESLKENFPAMDQDIIIIFKIYDILCNREVLDQNL